MIHVEALFVHHDQVHVPVHAAIEGEVRFLGVHPVIHAVVGDHRQGVFGFMQDGCDFLAEGGISAVVMQDFLSIQRYVGSGVYPPEFQVHAFRVRVIGRRVEYLSIDAAPPPVIVAAVLAVHRVPGVGQIDGDFLFVRPDEEPALVQGFTLSHSIAPFTLPRCAG